MEPTAVKGQQGRHEQRDEHGTTQGPQQRDRLAGGSFGKLATRLRVVRNDGSGRPVSLLRALGRSVLVALLVPPLLTFDGRGLHDVAAGTRTVTV